MHTQNWRTTARYPIAAEPSAKRLGSNARNGNHLQSGGESAARRWYIPTCPRPVVFASPRSASGFGCFGMYHVLLACVRVAGRAVGGVR
jgi:hypothetical protein